MFYLLSESWLEKLSFFLIYSPFDDKQTDLSQSAYQYVFML